MKKTYSCIRTVCTMALILLLQTSFAQEVETQHQQTNTDVTNVTQETGGDALSEQAQWDFLRGAARAANDVISPLHWETVYPTSVESILAPNKSSNSVDMSTGKVNVQVPIATVGTSDVKVPVGLNYSTGGIKLKDVASWVGLGWNLSAGGKITRSLNKYPDKFGWKIDSLLDATSWRPANIAIDDPGNFDARVKNQNADTQPDIFYYDIPGKTGMFILDNDGKAVTIPYQNVLINYDQTNKTFEIIDDMGTRYLFDAVETTEVKTDNAKLLERPDINYESTWHLTQILSIKGDVVDFEYKRLYTGSVSLKYSYDAVSRSISVTSEDEKDMKLSQVAYTTSVDPLYLTKISWQNGRMEFVSSKNRLDIPEQAFQLDRINLYSDPDGGTLLKSYNFGYGAFKNNALKLDSITVSTPKSATPEFFRKFEYFTKDYNLPTIIEPSGTNHGEHYFEYDHWGYYNGKTRRNQTGIPAFRIRDGNTIIYKDSLDDRSSSLVHTQANSLKKVWVSKSGYDEFEYELNTSKYEFNPYNPKSKPIAPVGGLRIKSITTKSEELGNASQKVSYEYTDEDGTSSGIVFNNLCYDYVGGYIGYTKYYIVGNSSVRSLFDLDGSHVRYGMIKEVFDNGSSTTYKFTTKENRPDAHYIGAVDYWTGDGFEGALAHDTLTSKHYDFAPVNTRFWERGLLTEKVSRDAAGKETSKETYKYNFNAPIQDTVHCLFPFAGESREGKHPSGRILIIVDPYLVYYDYISQPIYMTKKTVTGVDIPTTTTEYLYDDNDGDPDDLDHLLLKKEIVTCGSNKYTTTYKYPFDYTTSSGTEIGNAIAFMKENNISASPIEIVKYKNSEIIGGELYIYRKWHYMNNGSITGAMFNLKEVKELLLKKPKLISEFRESNYARGGQEYTFSYDNNYVTKTGYEYNRNNKPSCIKERNKPNLLSLYGSNPNLPIAQISNAEAKVINGSYCEEAFYNGFEDADGTTHPRAKSGAKVLTGGYYTDLSGLAAGSYWVSFWQSFNDGVDWELYETEVGVMENDGRPFTIGGQGAIIDEYRIWKKGAQMTTRTYDDNMNVTSETDVNGQTTYYEYDGFGRVLRILDNNRNKIKSYEYFIKK